MVSPQAASLGGVAERVAAAAASPTASAETPIGSVRRTPRCLPGGDDTFKRPVISLARMRWTTLLGPTA